MRCDERIAWVTMNRPQALNALSARMMDDLADAFQAIAADERIAVAVLTGAGRAFCAGADLAEMGRAGAPSGHGFAGMLDAMLDLPQPLILAVNGVAVGFGATVCGLADLVFMADTARLRCPFSMLGLTAEAGSTLTFPELMGRQRANWFLLSSQWMDASACRDAGLALEVFAADQLMERVRERAATLAALPGASLRATKRLLAGGRREALRPVIAAENEALSALLGGPANREAIAAFRDKRQADFSGL